MMADGSHEEVLMAQSAQIEGDDLMLRDASGAVVETVGRMSVTAFGAEMGFLREPPREQVARISNALASTRFKACPEAEVPRCH
jgi:hypothetical protein